jgi:hypothetical protein
VRGGALARAERSNRRAPSTWRSFLVVSHPARGQEPLNRSSPGDPSGSPNRCPDQLEKRAGYQPQTVFRRIAPPPPRLKALTCGNSLQYAQVARIEPSQDALAQPRPVRGTQECAFFPHLSPALAAPTVRKNCAHVVFPDVRPWYRTPPTKELARAESNPQTRQRPNTTFTRTWKNTRARTHRLRTTPRLSNQESIAHLTLHGRCNGTRPSHQVRVAQLEPETRHPDSPHADKVTS